MNEQLIQQYEELTMEAVADYNSSDFKTALKKFLNMAESNPKNSKILEIIVRLYLKLNRTEDARLALDRWKKVMEERFPGFCAKQRPSLEQLARDAGDERELEKQCSTILCNGANNPEDEIDTLTSMSFILLNRGEYEQAEKLLCSYRELLKATN